MQKLRREVEKAKRTLSYRHETRIEIESLINGQDFSHTLTRAKFEELNVVGSKFEVEIIDIQRTLHLTGYIYIYVLYFKTCILFHIGLVPINIESREKSFKRWWHEGIWRWWNYFSGRIHTHS